jgi:hypothetical protein
MADVKPTAEKLQASSAQSKMAPGTQAPQNLVPASTNGVEPAATKPAPKSAVSNLGHSLLHVWETNAVQTQASPSRGQPRVDCGPEHLNQNTDEVNDTGTAVACGSDCFTAVNAFARSFNLATLYPGQSFTVDCFTFGIATNTITDLDPVAECGVDPADLPIGGEVYVHCNVYRDTNGGAPVNPASDL